MGKKSTKAADNMFYKARLEAVQFNEIFKNRETTASEIGVNSTRLSRIELGTLVPYPEEVAAMADAYHSPELCNKYCANECPIGQTTVKELDIGEFDRLALQVLGSLKDIDSLRNQLIDIAEDGVVNEDEEEDFQSVLLKLEKISYHAQALHLWSKKNVKALCSMEKE